MPRNLYERVEVLVPLRDELLRERVHHEILDALLADNRKARILLRDATYIRAWQPLHGARKRKPPTGAASFSAQDFLIAVAEGKQGADAIPSQASKKKNKVLAGKTR
jgi:polyphosphate kinase